MSQDPPLTPTNAIQNLKTFDFPLNDLLSDPQRKVYETQDDLKKTHGTKNSETEESGEIELNEKDENSEPQNCIIVQYGTSNLFDIVVITVPSYIIIRSFPQDSSHNGGTEGGKQVEILPYPLKGNKSITSTFIANLLESGEKSIFSIKLGPVGVPFDHSLLHGAGSEKVSNDTGLNEVIEKGCKEIIFKRMEDTQFREVPLSLFAESLDDIRVQENENEKKDEDEKQGEESREVVKVGKMLIGYRFIRRLDIPEHPQEQEEKTME